MIHANEIVMFALGMLVFLWVMLSFKKLKRIPEWKLFWISFCLLLGAWSATILEEFFLNSFLNHVEHFLYMGAALLLLNWSIRITSSRSGGTE